MKFKADNKLIASLPEDYYTVDSPEKELTTELKQS